MREATLVIIKPDGVQRKLVGRIIQRFEEKELEIKQMKFVELTEEQLKVHYCHLTDEKFFPGLLNYMQSGPVVLLVLEGEQAVVKVRKMVGATDPLKAEAGTLRADFGLDQTKNLVHASDSATAGQKEIVSFFG